MNYVHSLSTLCLGSSTTMSHRSKTQHWASWRQNHNLYQLVTFKPRPGVNKHLFCRCLLTPAKQEDPFLLHPPLGETNTWANSHNQTRDPRPTPAFWWFGWAITQTKIKIKYGYYSNDLPSFYVSKANKEATRLLLKLQGRCNFIKSLSFSAASAKNKVLCQTWIHCH